MVDTGAGVVPGLPRAALRRHNPSATFLADSQDNDAWAVFANVTIEMGDKIELDAAIRYDEDKRENTTETPEGFLPRRNAARAQRPGPLAHLERAAAQGHAALTPPRTRDPLRRPEPWIPERRLQPDRRRRGRERQRHAGVNDLFEAEVAETPRSASSPCWPTGASRSTARPSTRNRRTAYFFVFSPRTRPRTSATSMRRYKGFELEMQLERDRQPQPVRGLRLHGQRHHGMEDRR